MRLRKKDFEVPKSFFVSCWQLKNLHGGSGDFLGGDLEGVADYCVKAR